jgi:cellulose synthase/poly-beta-1,6-N-acetylglucosamine synthase-like glycosyltransferase
MICICNSLEIHLALSIKTASLNPNTSIVMMRDGPMKNEEVIYLSKICVVIFKCNMYYFLHTWPFMGHQTASWPYMIQYNTKCQQKNVSVLERCRKLHNLLHKNFNSPSKLKSPAHDHVSYMIVDHIA